MPQIGEQSNDLIDRLATQGGAVTDLTKTVARGVPAIRDAAENVLELNPAATSPLLASHRHDVATGFHEGEFQILTADGQGTRGAIANYLRTGQSIINNDGVVAPSVDAGTFLAVGQSGITPDQMYGNSAVFGHVNLSDHIAVGSSIITGTEIDSGVISGSSLVSCGHSGMTTGQVYSTNGTFSTLNVTSGIIGTLEVQGGMNADAGPISTGHTGMDGHYVWADVFSVNSDRALKTDITPPTGDVGVAGFTPREFTWLETPERGRSLGFVAQELPERFRRVSEDGTLGYDPTEVLAAAVQTIKKLSDQVADLTKRVRHLEGGT